MNQAGTASQGAIEQQMKALAQSQYLQDRSVVGQVASAPPVTLSMLIGDALGLMDRLDGAMATLEKHLDPLLAPNYPELNSDGQTASQPLIIEEMCRLLARLRATCVSVDNIDRRVRI